VRPTSAQWFEASSLKWLPGVAAALYRDPVPFFPHGCLLHSNSNWRIDMPQKHELTETCTGGLLVDANEYGPKSHFQDSQPWGYLCLGNVLSVPHHQDNVERNLLKKKFHCLVMKSPLRDVSEFCPTPLSGSLGLGKELVLHRQSSSWNIPVELLHIMLAW